LAMPISVVQEALLVNPEPRLPSPVIRS
jgi:hypothetical protein